MKNNIAILIVSFNRREFVLKNLEAIKRLTYAQYDVILFDNGSTDGTIEVVSNLYSYVYIERSNENLGGAGGFASGMEYCYNKGYEYIWCLDDDGFPDKDALTILLNEAEKLSKPSILGTKIIGYENEKTIDTHFWPLNGKYNKVRRKIETYTPNQINDFITNKSSFETSSVALLGMFVSRSVIEKNGYPDARLFISYDDVEFCLRAWSNQIPVILVQKALIFHPINITTKINLIVKKIDIIVMNPFKLYYYIRNGIFVTHKYFSFYSLIKLLLLFHIIILYTILVKENKWETFKSGFLGIVHGFRKKLGKLNLQ